MPPPPPHPGRRSGLIAAAIIGVVLLAGAAVAAVMLARRTHSSHTGAPASPAGQSAPMANSMSVQSEPPSSPDAPTTPATPPSPTQPPPYAGNDVVSAAPDAGRNPLAPTAVGLLTRYFDDINSRDFTDYRLLFSQDMRARLDPAQVAQGYQSSHDSNARLTALTVAADGRTAATVTFTSTQNAADGPDGQTCTRWQVMFFLQTEGGRYVFGPHPDGYQAQHAAC